MRLTLFLNLKKELIYPPLDGYLPGLSLGSKTPIDTSLPSYFGEVESMCL